MNIQKEIDEFMPIYVSVITQTATEQQQIAYKTFMQGNIGGSVFHMPEFMRKANETILELNNF